MQRNRAVVIVKRRKHLSKSTTSGAVYVYFTNQFHGDDPPRRHSHGHSQCRSWSTCTVRNESF